MFEHFFSVEWWPQEATEAAADVYRRQCTRGTTVWQGEFAGEV